MLKTLLYGVGFILNAVLSQRVQANNFGSLLK